MRWILLDLALALVALAVLAVLVLGLWRKVKALSAAVRTASETIGQATDALAAAQLDGPLGAAPEHDGSPGTRPAPGGAPGGRARDDARSLPQTRSAG